MVLSVLALTLGLHGQGLFFFSNTHAPTHLYTIDGPLAGPEIYAQMLVGRSESSLEPVWHSIPHIRDGIAAGGEVEVLGITAAELAYIQMVAWVSRLWGTSLADVPVNQQGTTDAVVYRLSGGTQPVFAPYFSRSAVVPVPEPCVLLLCLIGFGGLCCFATGRWLDGRQSVFDKGTGERCAEAWTTNFFALTNNSDPPNEAGLFDGRIEFDAQAGRWVGCAIDAFGSGELFLAVSLGDSPTNLLGGWTNWRLPVAHPTGLTSSTTLGLDDRGIYLSVLHTDPDNGHTVIAIKKPEIYEGQLLWWTNDVPAGDLKTRSIRPAVNLDSGDTHAFVWFIGKGPPEAGPPYRGGAFYYRRLQWQDGMPDWADPNWRTVAENPVGYRDYFDLDEGDVTAPQKGGPTRIGLAHTGSRPMTVLMQDGFLWLCQHVGLDGTNDVYEGGTIDRSAVQWLKLEPGRDGALACVDQGRIYDPAPLDPLWYYWPSMIRTQAGDLVLSFAGSNAQDWIGVYYAYRFANGTAGGPVLLKAGEGYFNNHRWGDYSAATLDPENAATIWIVQEYAHAASGPAADWGTWIGQLQLPP